MPITIDIKVGIGFELLWTVMKLFLSNFLVGFDELIIGLYVVMCGEDYNLE